MAGDRLLEARELDDDEAVEFLRALENLELAAARQDLAAELLQDAWYQVGVLLVLIGIVDLRACDPIGGHLILHANRERPCWTGATAHSCCEVRDCLARTVRPMPNCFRLICFRYQRQDQGWSRRQIWWKWPLSRVTLRARRCSMPSWAASR